MVNSMVCCKFWPFVPWCFAHCCPASPAKNDASALEPHAMIKDEDSIHTIKYCVVTPSHSSSVGTVRKVSPNWSHETITCYSSNCFSIVLGQGNAPLVTFLPSSCYTTLSFSHVMYWFILTCLVLKLDSKKQGLSGEEGKRRQIFTEWPSASNRGRNQLVR